MSDERPEAGGGTPWWSRPGEDVWSSPRETGSNAFTSPGQPTTPSASWPAGGAFPPYPNRPPVERRGGGRRRLVALVALVALVSAVIGGAVGAAIEGGGNGTSGRATAPVDLGTTREVQPLASRPGSVAAIASKVLPSVVSINVTGSGQSDTGSGVVLSSDGYILTNNHVVAAAAHSGRITAVFYSKQTAAARIVGTDAQSDLAVIKATGVSGLRKADLGSSASLQVGDLVVAIGSPLGLSGTVTSGIVSAKDRPVTTSGEGSSETAVIDAIQTDAAINPGNSGGALVDGAGAVVGIPSAIATLGGGLGGQSGNIGVGFAIPIDEARTIAAELIRTGHATHPVIGVKAESLGGGSAQPVPGGQQGARVSSVTPGGGAAKAGIRPGDVITAVNGVQIAGVDALVVEIRKHQVGDRVTLTVKRGSRTLSVPVTLTSAGG